MDALSDIAVFVRVVERGSFTRAADELELSRAAVSKYLSRLEARLGARLLHRTTRRLTLTEAGAALFEASQGALERIEEAEESIARLQKEPRGRLKVSAPMGFGILYLGEAIAEFLRTYPAMSLDVRFDDRFVNLVEEGVDVAIRIGRLTDSTLVARKLGSVRTLACASPHYLAEHGEPESPEDLAAHNCLLYSYSSTANVWRFTAPGGREIPVAVTGSLRTNNGIAECEAAVAGLGVMVVPAFYAARPIREKKLKRILANYQLPELGIYAVYLQREHVPPKLRAFVDFLVERFRARPDWDRC
jgi:DNA-binding transcriptional LysR family regulator